MKGIFYSECDDKKSASSEDNDNDWEESSCEEDETLTIIQRSYPLQIAVASYFFFFRLFLRFPTAFLRL